MKNGDTVWIVGQYRSSHKEGSVWDLQGIFISKEEALAACKDKTGAYYPNWWVGSVKIGEVAPEESVDLVDGFYPFYSGDIEAIEEAATKGGSTD